MRMFAVAAVLAVCWAMLQPSPARAEVERHAILIANNRGLAHEAELRYAETDAAKVENVLRDLGGFPAENVTVLRGADPTAVRRALISVNDRLRNAGGDALLFVYYSGHAGVDGLHLGRAVLPHDELTKLVRGSPATIRLLVLDSCRSGVVTRRKGGRPAEEFTLAVEEALASEGAIFLSSSAGDEDSQESDELRGSFFTHYLVSGLVGAADLDADGRVAVDEAYRYAYENTLRASSRTEAGAQHPAFRYDVRGQGRVTLSWPSMATEQRGKLRVPPGRAYLVFADDAHGAVAAEIGERDMERTIALRPGPYFVRGRGPDDLLEGKVRVTLGATKTIDERELEQVAYARLVRRGGARPLTRAITFEATLRSGLYGGIAPCGGGSLGYRVDLRAVSLLGRASGCRASYRNEVITTTTYELGGEVGTLHVWDLLPSVSLELGVVAGASWLRQVYETRGVAPSHDALAPQLGVEAAASYDVHPRLALSLAARARTYFVRRTKGATDSEAELTAVFAAGVAVGFGWRH